MADYIPASLVGVNGNKLYHFGSIDTFDSISAIYLQQGTNAKGYYAYWIGVLYYNKYGSSIQTTRESIYPSAMVDADGILYTLDLWSFNNAVQGACFRLGKYMPGVTSVSQSSIYLYPWYEYAKSTTTFCCGCMPGYADDEDYQKFLRMGHNYFSPTIAQEVLSDGTKSDYLYIFGLFPPARWCKSNKSGWEMEGLGSLKIRKSNFNVEKTSVILRNDVGDSLGLSCQHLRVRASNCLPLPVSGFIKAGFDGNYINVYHIAHIDSTLPNVQIYSKTYNANDLSCPSSTWKAVPNTGTGCEQIMLYPRFQRFDDKIYWGSTLNGYALNLGIIYNNNSSQKLWDSYCDWVESWNSAVGATRYQKDFCIIKNGNQLIACILGFKAATTAYNASDFSQKYGWATSYVSWGLSSLVCVLYSFPLSNGTAAQKISGYNSTDLKTYPQNIIYNTSITRANGSAVDSINTTALGDRRLYLNTQNIVTYTTNSGHRYFIYAYCYPGKSKQLYLGFAPYIIDADNHVRLLTKSEFRDNNGNSFGNFTSCSRIISMDLKNNHLWITFMNADNSCYYYFHIKASDLVGE